MTGNEPVLVIDSSFFQMKKCHCNALWRDNSGQNYIENYLNYYKSNLDAAAHTALSLFRTKGVSKPMIFSALKSAVSSS